MLIIKEIEENIDARYPFRQLDQEYYNTLKTDYRRAQWLTSRVAVWEALGCYVDTLASGAPQIPHGYISISHTKNYVAIITGDHPVGIDIEECGRSCSRIAHKFTDRSETEVVIPLLPTNPQLVVWCAKEALYKYSASEGVEFIKDFRINGLTHDHRILATAMGESVELACKKIDNLLVVYTL